MSIVSKNIPFVSKEKIEYNDSIFLTASKAKKASLLNKNIFNATIGSLCNEDNSFFVFNSVFETFNNKVDDVKKASYTPSIDGGSEFSEITKKWIFKDNDFLYNSFVCATPGGSGALSSTINQLLDKDSLILIPDYSWDPFELMCQQNRINIQKYNMFENNCFSLKNLMLAIKDNVAKYKKIALYLNSPSHNPTSYSMTNNEWKLLINFLNMHNNNQFVIINDLAYIEFDIDQDNSYLKEFKNIKDHILVSFCISYSKSLTFYGLRLGASIIYHNDINISKHIYELMVLHARSNWSNVNHGAIETIILLDKNKEQYLAEKNNILNILKKRFDAFIESSKECGLMYLQTSLGFFISIEINKNILDQYVETLIKKDVYVVKLNKGIRIAICSLNIEQCKQLPKILKQTLDEVNNYER